MLSAKQQKERTKRFETYVEQWNAAHRVGTRVRVTKDDGSSVETTTRTRAMMLSGHTPVIFLEGISGCYLLTRVKAIETQPAQAAS
jgi:hypothetical protein